mmetsp:Transcript_5614/g.10705  ORF Transcript_5614/g.10705 Transcript_5614/m.10705 type:complete len:276 (+) Transcript_5614:41-868(+)
MDEVILFRAPSDESKLIVYNLPSIMDESTAWELFGQIGFVFEVAFKVSGKTCSPYAFVRYYCPSDARKAVAYFNQLKWCGKTISCKLSEERCKSKLSSSHFILPTVKCFDLANYLFGFNNWTNEIVELVPYNHARDQDKSYKFEDLAGEHSAPGDILFPTEYHPSRPSFTCAIKLCIGGVIEVKAWGVGHSRQSELPEAQWENARKRAVSNAQRNAFTCLAVVRLKNGKMDVIDFTKRNHGLGLDSEDSGSLDVALAANSKQQQRPGKFRSRFKS